MRESRRHTSFVLTLLGLMLASAGGIREFGGSHSSGADLFLKVTTVVFEPYTMIREDVGRRNVSGKLRYHGYIPDLLHKLSQVVGFDYDIYAVNGYGHKQANGWDGMVGELVEKRADIAAGPMYVTEYRDKVVDFTTPFMDVGATLLLRKPPAGHTLHIKSVADLINQSEIKYGTLNKGVIKRSFRTENKTSLRIMWRNMQKFGEPSVFTETNDEGIERVRQDKYAFVIPSTIGEYISMRYPCDLVTVDQFMMDRGYALALQNGSPLLARVNLGIHALRESGHLDTLYRKWWKNRNQCNGVRTSSRIYANSAVTIYSNGLMVFVLVAVHRLVTL